MRAPLVAFAFSCFAVADSAAQQPPPPAPRGASGVVHLLDSIPEPALSTLHSPALTPPELGEIAPQLAELELAAVLRARTF